MIHCQECQCRQCHKRVCSFTPCHCCDDCESKKLACGGFIADANLQDSSKVE